MSWETECLVLESDWLWVWLGCESGRTEQCISFITLGHPSRSRCWASELNITYLVAGVDPSIHNHHLITKFGTSTLNCHSNYSSTSFRCIFLIHNIGWDSYNINFVAEIAYSWILFNVTHFPYYSFCLLLTIILVGPLIIIVNLSSYYCFCWP